MIRFKVDENLPREAAELLRAAGHDALTVLEQQLGGEADPRISAVCLAEGRALLTLDLDFSDIRTYPPHELAGIVVLRLSRQDKQNVLDVLTKLLTPLAHEPLTGKLWIVDEARIRVRD